MSDAYLNEVAELMSEAILEMLAGCDDDDTVRTALVLEECNKAWGPISLVVPEGLTAGELRRRIIEARGELARGVGP